MRVISAILLSLILVSGAFAGALDDVASVASSEPPVKYEVTFTVRYNAVTVERASEIAREVMTKYQDACNVDVKSVKNNGSLLVNTGTAWINLDADTD